MTTTAAKKTLRTSTSVSNLRGSLLLRTWPRLLTLTILVSLISRGCPYFGARKEPLFTAKQSSPDGGGERCFCELQGTVDDCDCKIETIDNFNSRLVQPKIAPILRRSYFRYFRANLRKSCPFWDDDGRCALRDCAVEECGENDVPVGLKGRIVSEAEAVAAAAKYSGGKNKSGVKRNGRPEESAQPKLEPFGPVPGPPRKPLGAEVGADMEAMSCKEERNLSAVDSTLTAENKEAFKEWKKHDDRKEYFCELDDDDSDLQYVDLLKNPERFTGYSGPSAHRIWNSIYQENCFKEDASSYKSLLTQGGASESCLEKRVFYRVISGLHASINVHLSAEYLLKGSAFDSVSGVWGPNAAEFQRRFDPVSTDGRGPKWLRNLYFLYLLELRALAKVSPYLIANEKYFTGNKTEDELVQKEMRNLLETVDEFDGGHFDESYMFANKMEGLTLKEEFKEKFRNISRIMDCVGCDKCKLWGKIQVTGLGTALRILFPPADAAVQTLGDASRSGGSRSGEARSGEARSGEARSGGSRIHGRSNFSLQRSEVVALINAFGRTSSSIEYVHMFRDLLYK